MLRRAKEDAKRSYASVRVGAQLNKKNTIRIRGIDRQCSFIVATPFWRTARRMSRKTGTQKAFKGLSVQSA